jgi:hypothetical protein
MKGEQQMNSEFATNPLHNDMTDNNLVFVPSTTDSDSVLMEQIAAEGLRQAQQTFNMARVSFAVALIVATASAIVGLIGVGLLFSERTSEGTATAASGLVSSLVFVELAADARNRLDKANERLDKIAEQMKNE